MQKILKDIDPEGTVLREDTDLEKGFIGILVQITRGILKGVISLSHLVLQFMVPLMAIVGKLFG